MGSADVLNSTDIAFYAAAGAALGALYLGALWLTISNLENARVPLMMLFVSTVLRLSLLLGAIAWLTDMDWLRLAPCVAGFVAVRTLTIAWVRPSSRLRKTLVRTVHRGSS